MKTLFAVLAALLCGFSANAFAGDLLDNEDITPHVKIMDGPWVGAAVSGGNGAYTLRVRLPRNARYVLGLFDNVINRAGADSRSAVVLVDGVNPLVPEQRASGSADVSSFAKYPLDGVSFIAQDTAGKPAHVKVVDAKTEQDVGPVKPFAMPASRIDILLFAAPALPPVPGQAVHYGAPYLRYTILLEGE